jgi:hypothetical protein
MHGVLTLCTRDYVVDGFSHLMKLGVMSNFHIDQLCQPPLQTYMVQVLFSKHGTNLNRKDAEALNGYKVAQLPPRLTSGYTILS